ncbi:SIR2 family protein [Vibrio diabolicus]|uniref:SIR2 family anti-phage-associated protein n=1 Tax=Vibrio harveyi group TaxID=717610 RepID=UPI00215D473C|nr:MULTISPECIES: SIR2 family anti-phage-associated protein [Vibrio harveyi group]MCR9380549.1 SIR2 family protein [Vibrio alginolyticus]MCR9396277.1 SIR2 family protein [Vibrio alginolyticus]MCR9432709.1 SIR2 family protein [Vibrio alginolyticus]MCR9434090.1 SIR2 family protein [Vibrio alginolyticus]MCS0104822.1 SIR2 family protein [Vibrio alginolyticus]
MAELFYQGSSEIDRKDLESHLSSLCQLENVGVLLGAGASKSAGGMVMKEIWLDFKSRNEPMLPILRDQYKLISQEEIDAGSVNIELLIDEVLKNKSVVDTWQQDSTALFNVLVELYRSVTKAALLVNSDFPELHVGKNEKFDKHRNLLEKLLSNRQPGQAAPSIFTTNYDLAIEWSAEESGINLINGFSGINSRTFQPHSFDLGFRNINAVGEARFGHYNMYLYKLHGSLTWYQDQSGEVIECTSSKAYQDFINPLIKNSNFTENQRLIYPGANKYHHTIGFVYGEMFRRFSEFLTKPQTTLFVNGYGFGDYHINRIILGALLNPSLHIVICYPELAELCANSQLQNGLSQAQRCIDKIRKMKLNQVTIIGGTEAYFDNFVDLIPKPVLFPKNNAAKVIAEAIQDLGSSNNGE